MELKKYLQDRPILFLNVTVFFLAVFNILATLLRIDTSRTTAIIRYEVWKGLTGGSQDSVVQLYGFAFLALIILVCGIFFAYRLDKLNRSYSLLVLSLTIVTLIFNIIVSSAILNLQ